MYVREAGPKEFPQTFKEWMDQHASLRDMIAEGRSKLEWERKIPDEKLVDLKEMLNSKDFKANLPKVNISIRSFLPALGKNNNTKYDLFSFSAKSNNNISLLYTFHPFKVK